MKISELPDHWDRLAAKAEKRGAEILNIIISAEAYSQALVLKACAGQLREALKEEEKS